MKIEIHRSLVKATKRLPVIFTRKIDDIIEQAEDAKTIGNLLPRLFFCGNNADFLN